MEAHDHIPNPSDALWNLFGKPLNIDAVTLVEESWKETDPSETKKRQVKKQKERTD